MGNHTCRFETGVRIWAFGLRPLLLFLVLALIPVPAPASDFDMRVTGQWGTIPGYPAFKVVSDGRHAFALSLETDPQLLVIDLADRTRLQRVAGLPMSGALDLALTSNQVFVAARTHGLHVINVESPTNPKLEATLATTGMVTRVAVRGGLAAVVEIPLFDPAPGISPGLVRIADVSDPSHPRWIGDYSIPAEQRSSISLADVAISDGVVCVASGGYNAVEARQVAILEVLDLADPSRPRRASVHQATGLVHAMTLSGRRVLWAPYERTFGNRPFEFKVESRTQLLSLDDLEHPQLISSLTTVNDEVREVVLADSRAYLAGGLEGGAILDVLDLSHPNAMRSLGRTVLFDGIAGLEYSLVQTAPGIILAAGSPGLKHVDVTDPAAAVVLGALETEIGVASTATQGDLVVVTHPTRGTEWLDIRGPAQPKRIGTLDLPGYRVATLGNLALLKAINGGVHVVDASNPAQPRLLKSILSDSARSITDLLLTLPTAFVADADSGIHIVNLTDPANPVVTGRIPPRHTGASVSLAQSGNHLFIAQNSQLGPLSPGEVLDIYQLDDPANPRLLKSFPLRGAPTKIVVAGQIAYIAEWIVYSANGLPDILEILDISDPANPRAFASYDTHGSVDNFSISGDRLFLTVAERDRLGGYGLLQLQVLDLTVPYSPQRIGGYSLFPYVQGGFQWSLVGDRLLVTGPAGIPILDLGSPAALPRRANLDTPGFAAAVAVSPTNPAAALVADGPKGIRIFNVESPDQPQQVTALAIRSGSAERIRIEGSRAYVAAREGGFLILDVANPLQPKLIRTQVVTNAGHAVDVTDIMVKAGRAFVAGGSDGMKIFNIQTPTAPQEIGAWKTRGTVSRIASLGDLLVLAEGLEGLEIVDVSNPQTPTWVSQLDTLGTTSTVTVDGERAYIANGLGGLSIIDLSHPATPSVLGTAPDNCFARDIVVSGHLAYVADTYRGIRVFDCTDVTRPREIGGTTAADTWGLALLGDTVLAAGGYSGFWAFGAISNNTRLALFPGSEPNTRTLRIDGPAGTSARVQQSADLRTWIDHSSVVLGDIPLTVSIPFTPNSPATFFRVSSSP
ncbi:MAG: hypothetical protein IT581_18425 [Verrucomicrobiales bacterium]|nr:hypothetical protein [Verrucomicrobiales bacterium]